VTPRDWECLDGTLYVDANDQPWLVFCHEWVQIGDGAICALRLNDDLASATGQPQLLFHASEAAWAHELNSKGRKGYVTDGPWIHRTAKGHLLMLWSSFSHGDYAVGVAQSTSGEITGPWQQEREPLYAGDGGHCMTFRSFEGQRVLTYHRPNASPNERPYFVPLYEQGSSVSIIEK
jgi:hypothetical protein